VESPPPYRNVGSSTLNDNQWADRWGTPTEAQVAKTYLYSKRDRTMSRAAGVAVAGGGGEIPPQPPQPSKGSPLSPLQDPLLAPSRPGTPVQVARADRSPSPMRRLTAPDGRRSGEVEMASIQQAAAAMAAAMAVGEEEVLSLDEQADRSFLEKTAARTQGRTQRAAAGGEEEGSSSEDEDIWRSSQRARMRMQGRAEPHSTEEAVSQHAADSVSTTERRPGGDQDDGGGGRRPVQRGTTTSYGQQHTRRETHSSSEFNLDEDEELMLRELASTDLLVIGQVQSDDLNAVD
jgi:hypothetical protein